MLYTAMRFEDGMLFVLKSLKNSVMEIGFCAGMNIERAIRNVTTCFKEGSEFNFNGLKAIKFELDSRQYIVTAENVSFVKKRIQKTCLAVFMQYLMDKHKEADKTKMLHNAIQVT